jgi:hypothetical protein
MYAGRTSKAFSIIILCFWLVSCSREAPPTRSNKTRGFVDLGGTSSLQDRYALKGTKYDRCTDRGTEEQCGQTKKGAPAAPSKMAKGTEFTCGEGSRGHSPG